MSIIFGVVEKDRIILCGDKRLSTKNEAFVSDNAAKIKVINCHLAVASAGNEAISMAVEMETNKKSPEDQTVESILTIIKEFYSRVDSVAGSTIGELPYCALIAGKSEDGNSKMISLSRMKGNLSCKEVTLGLYQPADMDYQDCVNIFAKNYKLNYKKFCELTVWEVSQNSKLVSPTGMIWIYDRHSKTGMTTDF